MVDVVTADVASTLSLVEDATWAAVVTETLTLTLADVVEAGAAEEGAADDVATEEDAAGAEPSQVTTGGPGMAYGFPPLSGWPELP